MFCIPKAKCQWWPTVKGGEVYLVHFPGSWKAWCLCGLSSDKDLMAYGSWLEPKRSWITEVTRKQAEPQGAGLTSFRTMFLQKERNHRRTSCWEYSTIAQGHATSSSPILNVCHHSLEPPGTKLPITTDVLLGDTLTTIGWFGIFQIIEKRACLGKAPKKLLTEGQAEGGETRGRMGKC